MINLKINLPGYIRMAILVCFNYATIGQVLSGEGNYNNMKPFRVLVVISDQWKDPSSFIVNMPKAPGLISGYDDPYDQIDNRDFHSLMVLLKSWSIPFDVVRLDQQFLNRYMFLNMDNSPRYGTIIWNVKRSEKLLLANYEIITEMVKDCGIGLIALSDRIDQPAIQELLGIDYRGSWESNDPITLYGKHYLISGVESPLKPGTGTGAHLKRQQVEVKEGTKILAYQGSFAQVTARELPGGSRTVWIGNDPDFMFSFQGLRRVLRNAITWTIGYNLYKTWDKTAILVMDDPGNAQNAWLKHWHYTTLSEETITEHLIKPLKKSDAVLNINFVPGFVNDSKRELEPSWTQQFVDTFGLAQDYVSSKRGYDKGVREGVFEVMCHGLTHMQPDLSSDPGWYGSDPEQERSEVGWYREFGDSRRRKEIPAAEQIWRMNTGREWLSEQFGVTPLSFCAGGDETSLSYFNNTARLAAKAGFGWFGWESWETGYLGTDMVIMNWDYFGTADSPLIVPVSPNAHDFGIALEPGALASQLKQFPGYRFISMNEFIGYLHANNTGNWNKNEKKLLLTLDYNTDYCGYFENHDSEWVLEVADWLLDEQGTSYSVSADRRKQLIVDGPVRIKPGIGKHTIEISF